MPLPASMAPILRRLDAMRPDRPVNELFSPRPVLVVARDLVGLEPRPRVPARGGLWVRRTPGGLDAALDA